MGDEVTEALHTFKIGSFLARVEYDDAAQSPDEWGVTECFLGQLSGCTAVGRKGWAWERDEDEDCIIRPDGGYELEDDELLAYPVAYYADSWGSRIELALDEGQDCHGAIFVEKVHDLELLVRPHRDPLARVEALVKVWNQWLSGEIYMISVLDSDGELVECIGGFWDEDGAVEAAKTLAQGRQETENDK